MLAFLVLVLGFVLRNRYMNQHRFQTPGQFAQWLATEAVKDAKESSQITLDYTPDSIRNVENILGHIHEQYVKNPSSVSANGLGSAYGAYIGEVIRRSEADARWERDDTVGGEKSYPIIWGGGHSCPMAWCYHRIVNGPGDNIWIKYRALKEQRDKRLGTTAN